MTLGPWSNEHSWELKNTHEHGAMGSWTLIFTHEHSLCHSTIIMSAHECLWVFMSVQEGPWVIISANECSWCHSHVCSWLLLSIHEHSWALISSHEHSRAWRHDMVPIPLMTSKEHWWALHHGTITTHSALVQYLSVPMSAHKCSWVLLRIVELPWVFKFLIQ